MNRNTLIITSAFLLAAPLAEAILLVGWDVDGITTSGLSLADSTSVSNVEESTLSLGSGVIADTAGDRYGFKISSGTTTLAAAITANHYIEFDVTASSGYLLNLSSVELVGQASRNGANDVAIFASLDGFSTSSNLGSATNVAIPDPDPNGSKVTGGFDTDSDGFGGPIDLTGSTYQGVTGTVTFRIYGWNTTSDAGITYIRDLSGNDLEINGTVSAIPEVSTGLPLASLLGLTIIGFRRRKA